MDMMDFATRKQGVEANQRSQQLDEAEIVKAAQHYGSGDRSLFSSALDYLGGNKDEHEQPIDEEHVQDAHRRAYQEDSGGSLSAGSMGSAAALQVLKSFAGGSGPRGGSSQSQLISMAMAEASKLFDKSGGAASGNKQDAVNGAAMTVMKLMVQSKVSSAIGAGSGIGGLLSNATKFA